MKKAFKLQAQGRKLGASKYYTYLIKNGIKDSRVFSNYGIFLNEIGKPKKQNYSISSPVTQVLPSIYKNEQIYKFFIDLRHELLIYFYPNLD